MGTDSGKLQWSESCYFPSLLPKPTCHMSISFRKLCSKQQGADCRRTEHQPWLPWTNKLLGNKHKSVLQQWLSHRMRQNLLRARAERQAAGWDEGSVGCKDSRWRVGGRVLGSFYQCSLKFFLNFKNNLVTFDLGSEIPKH